MKISTTLLLCLMSLTLTAQSPYLNISPTVVLSKDSVQNKILTSAISDFLTAAESPNENNKLILPSEKIETFLLLDEINGIEKSGKYNDEHFYKPYLTNLVAVAQDKFLIQVSYIGVNANLPLLRASFEFLAHKAQAGFLFSSPLISNTKHWKTEKSGNNVFHYQYTVNKAKLKEFNSLTKLYDTKIKVENKTVDYYGCDNIFELERLVGVLYKSDYNGRAESVWSSSSENRKLVVLGNNNSTLSNFDPHDLFHDRLSLVVSRSKVNKPVDEGCAYLYGGSWGLTWKEIFKAFKDQVAVKKETNWMDIKEQPVYFQTEGYSNSADFIVNALLIKKIEKEKGFEGVWQLLNVGPFEQGNEKYYKTLEKLTGITKANYNSSVWALIEAEK